MRSEFWTEVWFSDQFLPLRQLIGGQYSEHPLHCELDLLIETIPVRRFVEELGFKITQILLLLAAEFQSPGDVWFTKSSRPLALNGDLRKSDQLFGIQNSCEFQFVLSCSRERALPMLFAICVPRAAGSSSTRSFQTFGQGGNFGPLFGCDLKIIQHRRLTEQKRMPVCLQQCQIGENPFDAVSRDTQFRLRVRTLIP